MGSQKWWFGRSQNPAIQSQTPLLDSPMILRGMLYFHVKPFKMPGRKARKVAACCWEWAQNEWGRDVIINAQHGGKGCPKNLRNVALPTRIGVPPKSWILIGVFPWFSPSILEVANPPMFGGFPPNVLEVTQRKIPENIISVATQ